MSEKQSPDQHEVFWTTEKNLVGSGGSNEAQVKIWHQNEYNDSAEIIGRQKVIKRVPVYILAEDLPQVDPALVKEHNEETVYRDFEMLTKLSKVTSRVPKPIKLAEITNHKGEVIRNRTGVYMEMIEGPDLFDYLENNTTSAEQLAIIMADVVNSAEIMRDNGYEYRDWKVDSIKMDSNQGYLPRIIDITTNPLITFSVSKNEDFCNVTPERVNQFSNLLNEAATKPSAIITKDKLPVYTEEDEVYGLCTVIRDVLELLPENEALYRMYDLTSKVLRRTVGDPKNPDAPKTLAELKIELQKIAERK